MDLVDLVAPFMHLVPPGEGMSIQKLRLEIAKVYDVRNGDPRITYHYDTLATVPQNIEVKRVYPARIAEFAVLQYDISGTTLCIFLRRTDRLRFVDLQTKEGKDLLKAVTAVEKTAVENGLNTYERMTAVSNLLLEFINRVPDTK